MNECEKYQEMISAMLDGELTEAEKADVMAHIAVCGECSAMYAAFSAIGGAMEADDVPDTLHHGIMQKVNAAAKAKQTQRKIIRLRPILTAAACLVVIVGTVFAIRENLPGMGSKKDAAPKMMYMTAANSMAGGENFSAAADTAAADTAAAEEWEGCDSPENMSDSNELPVPMPEIPLTACAPEAKNKGDTEVAAVENDCSGETAEQMTVTVCELVKDGFTAVNAEDDSVLIVRMTENTEISEDVRSALKPESVVTVEYETCLTDEMPVVYAVRIFAAE